MATLTDALALFAAVLVNDHAARRQLADLFEEAGMEVGAWVLRQPVPALRHQPDDTSTHYAMDPAHDRAWVHVHTISVCLTRTDEGVAVDLYPENEFADALSGCWATFEEARDTDDDEEDTA